MKRGGDKAPDGEWVMPNDRITSALGKFVMGWSLVESALEICIASQLGLAPLEGSTVTAGLQFRGRAALLLSLLERNAEKNEAAIEIVESMLKMSDRNDIMHSVLGGGRDVIWFNRRTTNSNRFKSKIVCYDADQLLKLTLRCTEMSFDLGVALGLGPKDYLSFFQESHNAVNRD